MKRRLPAGAEPLANGSTHFRVWAPDHHLVEVEVEVGLSPRRAVLKPEKAGWFSGLVEDVPPGSLYGYRLDDSSPLPDPVSRFQPHGPEGLSEVIDPDDFEWTDMRWKGVHIPGQIIYEMHVGTFTGAGTWAAATERLPELADLGVTLLELMPVAEFAGRFGWGYDGVDYFAPYHRYGRPNEMRMFVDEAHRLGLGVILDVVYNHFGPVGNYLARYGAAWISRAHTTDWGPAPNYDEPSCAAVRSITLANADLWIHEYHLDGLRLDATQNIEDDSTPHIMAEMTERARAVAGKRSIVIVGENEPQHTRLLRATHKDGWGLDALWNDDLHHSGVVALTGRKLAYFSDYRGTANEFVAAVRHGFLYQGQRYPWQKKRRGEPGLDLPHHCLISYWENHDQVANSERGERLHMQSSPAQYRAMLAFLLLGPATPMLFQGQEWNSSKPFFYFADHADQKLADLVAKGRLDFLSQFATAALPEVARGIPHPGSEEKAFRACILDWSERTQPANARMLQLHRDLIRMRRTTAAFAPGATYVDAAVLTPAAWLVRWISGDDDRLLIVNLGRTDAYDPPVEPLLAPPAEMRWTTEWSSEDPAYGGRGTPEVETEKGWTLPGPCAVLLAPRPLLSST